MYISSGVEAVVSFLPAAGAVIAFSMYYPLCKRIRAGNASQNIATFFLWGLLDTVAAGSTFLQHGNFLLPFLYVVGCIAVIHSIVRAGTWKWTLQETVASLFVAGSIIVWMFVSSEWATIVSTLGVAAAGVPQLIDGWKEPEQAPLDLYMGFTLGNALSLASLTVGHRFTIGEHFYGASCTLLTVAFVLVAMRRWLPSQQHQAA